MNEAQLEQLVADRVAAMRDAVPIRPDFQIRIMRVLETTASTLPSPLAGEGQGGGSQATTTSPRRRVAREVVLALAVVVFVALLAGGAAWLRSQSHAAHHRVPAPTVSAAALIGVSDIHMVTAQVGWAFTLPMCSHGCYPTSILRTTDGGLHWTNTTGPLSQPVANPGGIGYQGFPPGEFFLDSTHAWYAEFVSGPANLRAVIHSDAVVIHSTSDGGVTWKQLKAFSVVPGGQKILLQFVDARHGWITIGTGGDFEPWEGAAIYQTVDGGTSWNEVQLTPWPFGGQPTVGSLPARCLKTAVFVDATRGWASGSCPAVNNLPDPGPVFFYRTTNAGRTWSRQALPVPAGYPSNWFDNCICSLTPVQYPDPEDGTIVLAHDSGSGSFSQYLFITHDGGSTWDSISPPKLPTCSSNPSAPAVDFITGSVGWLTECDAIYGTEDGGTTWTLIGQSPQFSQASVLDFVDQSHGWAILGTFRGLQLFRTSDGGRTWSQ